MTIFFSGKEKAGDVKADGADSMPPRRMLWSNLLSRQGYFCFVVEVRAWLAKSKAIETSDYRQAYGQQNVKDILAAVRWIKQIPGIDPERIGILGGSGSTAGKNFD